METYYLEPKSSYIKYLNKIPFDTTTHFDKIWSLKPEQKPTIRLFNKLIETPRYYNSFGKDYKFSNTNCISQEIPDVLKPYLNFCNENNDDSKYEYNGILVNYYDGPEHYIGYHSDDEKELVKNSDIYCFSLGDSRDFCLKSNKTKEVFKIKLMNNSLVIMGGTCQNTHKHSIPKRKKAKKRISITVRKFKK